MFWVADLEIERSWLAVVQNGRMDLEEVMR